MAYLAIIGSHRVNGVAELHSGLVKEMFHDFVDIMGADRFTNVTNGITARRWLLQCNPSLADLITTKLGSEGWLTDLYKLEGLAAHADDLKFQKQFYDIKQANKDRLATYIEKTLGIEINRNALFDVMCKRIHEYKRQFMNIVSLHNYWSPDVGTNDPLTRRRIRARSADTPPHACSSAPSTATSRSGRFLVHCHVTQI